MSDTKDPIKEAFSKAKQDILSLQSQLYILKQEFQELKRTLSTITNPKLNPADRQTDQQTRFPTINPTNQQENPSIRHINPTDSTNPTHNPTDNYPLEALKSQILSISTGNKGVPTDRQTNQQTDTSTGNKGVEVRFNTITTENPTPNPTQKPTKIDRLEKVAEFLDSLDDIKKELRAKIKRLTKQEMAVFTAIYQLEEQGLIVDYALLAEKLSLTESSIRDYSMRIIKKGIPVDKSKENNKKIILSISKNLKKIASLATILQLKEL